MPAVIIYTTRTCPYCIMAKRLLSQKGVDYEEINVDTEAGLRKKLIERTQRRTVPQIFIGDYHLGGFEELYALEQQKKLDALLAG
jgi:glutaredoxin 3